MFDQVLMKLIQQKEDYIKLKKEVESTSLEKSIDDIIKTINHDINKIVSLNQIERIY
jgi:hypothetical protein